MMKIEIISGSPRVDSLTKRVALHLLHTLSTSGARIGLIDMQVYSVPPIQQVWTSPDDAPPALRPVAQRIFEADAFVLVSPEYNGSYSPALKNFIDHFPKQERKVFGIAAASPGNLGGIRAALQLQTLVSGIAGIAVPRMLVVPDVERKFDSAGTLIDAKFKPSVISFQEDFLWLCETIVSGRSRHERLLVA